MVKPIRVQAGEKTYEVRVGFGLLGKIGACGDMPSGFIEQNDMPLRQASLYEAQLCDRLRP